MKKRLPMIFGAVLALAVLGFLFLHPPSVWYRKGNSIVVHGRSADGGELYLELTPCSSRIFRARVSPTEDFHISGLEKYGLIKTEWGFTNWEVFENNGKIIVHTETIDVEISRSPLKLTFRVGENVLLEENGLKIENGRISATFLSNENEHFFGFGQQFDYLDKRGRTVLAQVRYEHENGERGTLTPVPFFMSTKGYGIFVDTTYAVTFHMADQSPDLYSFEVNTNKLNYFLIYGPSFKEILKSYTDITGKPPLPPKWAFGYWQSKFGYTSRSELENVAFRLRSDNYPADVLVLDYFWRKRFGIRVGRKLLSAPRRDDRKATRYGF
jgi:alpha-glucosidase (family GH31 glycosyl hydrolase)